MSTYKHLFTPLKIGSLDIPNRVFMSPHGMIGLPIGSPQQVGYFEARAKGGAGFLGIASTLVQPATRIPPGLFIRAYSREDIPAIRKITDGIHKWGAKVFVQGVWMMADTDQAQASSIAPHTVLSDTQPRSMTLGEIQELIDAHGIAAVHAREAGADGFEFPIGEAQVCRASLRRFTTTAPTITAVAWKAGCGLS